MMPVTAYRCLCADKECNDCQKDWRDYFVTAKYLWFAYTKLYPSFTYQSSFTKRRWCYGIADDLERLIKQKQISPLLAKIITKVGLPDEDKELMTQFLKG